MKIFLIILVVVIILLGFSRWWSWHIQSKNPNIISRSGIHWHPELEIYVDGRKIDIPKNIGLMNGENPIHTHSDLPLIHLEFSGMVRKDNIRIGKFFEVWGKNFYSFGPDVTMTVNGGNNIEFENYIMHDGDKIVLRYSK